MKQAFSIIILALILGLICLPHMALANGNGDQTIKAMIEKRLTDKELAKNNEIQVLVENKTVTLTGIVSNLKQKSDVEKEVHKAAKDYVVVDNLQIKQLNLSDNELFKKVVKRLQ